MGSAWPFPSVVLSSRPPSITSPGSTPWTRTQHSDSYMQRESHKVSPFYVGKMLLFLQFPIHFTFFKMISQSTLKCCYEFYKLMSKSWNKMTTGKRKTCLFQLESLFSRCNFLYFITYHLKTIKYLDPSVVCSVTLNLRIEITNTEEGERKRLKFSSSGLALLPLPTCCFYTPV